MYYETHQFLEANGPDVMTMFLGLGDGLRSSAAGQCDRNSSAASRCGRGAVAPLPGPLQCATTEH